MEIREETKERYPWADGLQLRLINIGLSKNLDVSVYADPKYDWRQMDQIRLGLYNGVDVSKYNDPKIPWEEMEQIRNELLNTTYNNKQKE